MRTIAAALLAASLAAPCAADPVLIRMANGVAANAHMNVQVFQPWCDRVTAESEGTVEAKLFPANSIAHSRNIYDRILNGIVDIGYVTSAYVAGKFPRTGVTQIPFEVDSSAPASLALWRMTQPGGALAEEWSDVRLLAIFAYPGSGFAASYPIRKMEDLKGKKIGVSDKLQGDWVAAMGGAPIALNYTDTYESLNRGMVNAVSIGWTGVQPLKLWEVAKFHTVAKMGAPVVALAMSKQSYAKLDAKGKAAIDRNSGEKWTRELGVFWDRIAAEGRELVAQQKDNTIFDLDDAEIARWAKASEPIVAQWVKETPDGAKVLAEFRRERDKAAGI
jgi:TRAP-type C4-dicarboxylate transport system substrate-binding protein